jgi:hypothetical protein
MAFLAMHVHHKADATSIVLESRIVQTLALARVEWKLRLHDVHLSAEILCVFSVRLFGRRQRP